LFALVSLCFFAIGSEGLEVRHGAEHDAARHHEQEHETAPAPADNATVDHHNDAHPHPSVGSALREPGSAALFIGTPPALLEATRDLKPRPRVLAGRAEVPFSGRSTGPPPSLRAPPLG